MKTETKPAKWKNAMCTSVRGASHERGGTCCQDAVSLKEGCFRGEPYIIGSTADGHGHPDYTHSERGAALAISSAEQTALQFMLAWDDFIENPEVLFEHYFREYLKDEWLRNIAQSRSVYRVRREMARRHGSTLLTVLIFRGRVFMAQLGDGEICRLNNKGQAIFLVEPECGPISSATDSLCSEQVHGLWRIGCVPVKDISFLMLSSDGLINSLDPEEYVKLTNTLDDYLRRFPAENVKKALPHWLSDYSTRGSKDDISLVAICMKETNNDANKEQGEQHENKH